MKEKMSQELELEFKKDEFLKLLGLEGTLWRVWNMEVRGVGGKTIKICLTRDLI